MNGKATFSLLGLLAVSSAYGQGAFIYENYNYTPYSPFSIYGSLVDNSGPTANVQVEMWGAIGDADEGSLSFIQVLNTWDAVYAGYLDPIATVITVNDWTASDGAWTFQLRISGSYEGQALMERAPLFQVNSEIADQTTVPPGDPGIITGPGITVSTPPLTLVDIHFDGLLPGETPPVLGSSMPPALPSDRLTTIQFGDVLGTNNVPGMENPVALLRAEPVGSGSLAYSQPVVYDDSNIPSAAGLYFFSLDFLLSDFQKRTGASRSVDEFTILFDLPRSQRIDFTTDGLAGRVSVGGGVPNYVGGFEFDRPHNLAMLLDLDRFVWSSWLDGQLLFEDAALPRGFAHLASVRINLSDDVLLSNAPIAYVDNIRLVAFPDELIILDLPDAAEVECGARPGLSALVGHAKGSALDLVWSLGGIPVATNSLPAGTPLNLMQVEFSGDLPLGENWIDVKATDPDGVTASTYSILTVVDSTPPAILVPAASPALLWPPNGKMIHVSLTAIAEDACSPANWKVHSISCSESNHDASDVRFVGDHEVALRATRSGNSKEGRIYTIWLKAEDTAGNESGLVPVSVTVPHDQRNKAR